MLVWLPDFTFFTIHMSRLFSKNNLVGYLLYIFTFSQLILILALTSNAPVVP